MRYVLRSFLFLILLQPLEAAAYLAWLPSETKAPLPLCLSLRRWERAETPGIRSNGGRVRSKGRGMSPIGGGKTMASSSTWNNVPRLVLISTCFFVSSRGLWKMMCSQIWLFLSCRFVSIALSYGVTPST